MPSTRAHIAIILLFGAFLALAYLQPIWASDPTTGWVSAYVVLVCAVGGIYVTLMTLPPDRLDILEGRQVITILMGCFAATILNVEFISFNFEEGGYEVINPVLALTAPPTSLLGFMAIFGWHRRNERYNTVRQSA